jgi:hypothetical protein
MDPTVLKSSHPTVRDQSYLKNTQYLINIPLDKVPSLGWINPNPMSQIPLASTSIDLQFSSSSIFWNRYFLIKKSLLCLLVDFPKLQSPKKIAGLTLRYSTSQISLIHPLIDQQLTSSWIHPLGSSP